eukprot:c3869_g1_i1.p1 GENE.c3869_g1_i1~~c3869_g1_i1.p1  ORF type:complete len:549 (-),score=129.07 c3869_g1_i1:104-1750(-)
MGIPKPTEPNKGENMRVCASVFLFAVLAAAFVSASPFSRFSSSVQHEIENAQKLEAVGNFSAHQPHHHHKRVSNLEVGPLDIDIVTWNVGNTVPNDVDVALFFANGADLVVVGVQESAFDGRESFAQIIDRIAQAQHYNQLTTAHVGSFSQIQIFAFERVYVPARRSIFRVENYGFDVTRGMFPVFWYKGGVGIVLDVDGTRLTFITAHLAAHMKEMNTRNADAHAILVGSHKVDPNLDITFTSHHTFWFGDLNYRVDNTYAHGKAYANQKDNHQPNFAADFTAIETLATTVDPGAGHPRLAYLAAINAMFLKDQLSNQRAIGNVLADFVESPITFRPTFKHAHNSDGLNPHYEAVRIPSFCDRILHKSLPGVSAAVVASGYKSFPDIVTSDHRPVTERYTLTLFPNAVLGVGVPRDLEFELGFLSIPASNYIQTRLNSDRTFYVSIVSHPANLLAPIAKVNMHRTSKANRKVIIKHTVPGITVGAFTENSHIVVTLHKSNSRMLGGEKILGHCSVSLNAVIDHMATGTLMIDGLAQPHLFEATILQN